VAAAFRAMSTPTVYIMAHITGKIGRNIMARIERMIASQPDQREHELADQDGTADHGANQKKSAEREHRLALEIGDLEREAFASSSLAGGNSWDAAGVSSALSSGWRLPSVNGPGEKGRIVRSLLWRVELDRTEGGLRNVCL
jgi:hypothetical protein